MSGPTHLPPVPPAARLSRYGRWYAIAIWLMVLGSVPVAQLAWDIGQRPGHPWRVWRGATEVWNLTARQIRTDVSLSGVWAWNGQLAALFQGLEREAQTDSEVLSPMRRTVQSARIQLLSAGNSSVLLAGQQLYFRPDLDFLTSPGLAQPRQSPLIRESAQRVSDPLPAIAQFQRDLAARGIRLLLVPVPVKAQVLPPGQPPATPPLRHPEEFQLYQRLEQAGVAVCDLLPVLIARPEQPSPFLRDDTHWSSAGMEAAAQKMADQCSQLMSNSEQRNPPLPDLVRFLQGQGDLVPLLGLTSHLPGTTAETVSISIPLALPQGPPKILLLGDSFTNIYSQTELGWGTGAGLAEQLAWRSQQPVRTIAINAGGALGSRRELIDRMRRGPDPLAGIELVVWEFAAREWAQGDWQITPMPVASPNMKTQFSMQTAGETRELRIISRSELPDLARFPYRNVILTFAVELPATDTNPAQQAIVMVWGLRDRQQSPAAAWQVGQVTTLQLKPWEEVAEEYERYTRTDLDEAPEGSEEWPYYWGTISE